MQSQRELIHSTDWRTLFIMDAMRFDVFKEIVEEDHIKGTLTPVWSPGCETGVWMRELWTDTVYKNMTLISNSVIYWKSNNRYILSKFSKTVPLWKGRVIEEGAPLWGDVMPTKEVLEYAQKEHIISPKKMIIIHDMPPHLPFCADAGYQFLEKLIPKKDVDFVYSILTEYGQDKKGRFDELRGYYKESARKTLHTILKCGWLQERGGLVISADHGEMIGEHDQYGHSLNYPEDAVLRTVPWLTEGRL